MALTITVMKEDSLHHDYHRCLFYIDEFSEVETGGKFAMTANPLTFIRRALFTQDKGESVFELPLEEAKKIAKEILEL